MYRTQENLRFRPAFVKGPAAGSAKAGTEIVRKRAVSRAVVHLFRGNRVPHAQAQGRRVATMSCRHPQNKWRRELAVLFRAARRPPRSRKRRRQRLPRFGLCRLPTGLAQGTRAADSTGPGTPRPSTTLLPAVGHRLAEAPRRRMTTDAMMRRGLALIGPDPRRAANRSQARWQNRRCNTFAVIDWLVDRHQRRRSCSPSSANSAGGCSPSCWGRIIEHPTRSSTGDFLGPWRIEE